LPTHLLEQKVDIRVIQVLLGHKKLETTALYAQVATEILREVISPLEKIHPPARLGGAFHFDSGVEIPRSGRNCTGC
jgi:site-specific recombinase XerC